jgi:hypothetical protein
MDLLVYVQGEPRRNTELRFEVSHPRCVCSILVV